MRCYFSKQYEVPVCVCCIFGFGMFCLFPSPSLRLLHCCTAGRNLKFCWGPLRISVDSTGGTCSVYGSYTGDQVLYRTSCVPGWCREELEKPGN